MKPLVSIIIPVYNAASFLSECLDSVINQTYKNLEIICVNDGSTDASLSIIKKYAKKDKRIRYYTQKNKGQSAARNIGIKMCKGEYISFIDSDDMIDLHTISVAVDLFLNEHVDMVLYNMEMFLPDGTRFICFNGELFPYESKRMNTRQKECIINFTNAAPSVIRKSSINSTFVEGMIYEDWVFMVRHLLQSLNVFWINEPFYKYRRNFEKSTTSNISYKCLDLFKAYYLSKKYIESSPMKNTYNYINDIKILNEASGFIHANLIGTDYSELTDRYISELIEIIHSFSNIYYLFLISFLNPERKALVNIIEDCVKRRTVSSNNYNIYIKIRNEYYGIFHFKILKRKIENLINTLIFIFKHKVKKIMKIIFPAYRVSSSVREILQLTMFEMAIRLDKLENNSLNESENNLLNKSSNKKVNIKLSEEEILWILERRIGEKKQDSMYNSKGE
ncbi:glycosyltransferase family 2 protein [uncultured Clostridium sp.]|uniref:glycosyltransferase family 2 protein n=1 Tax=uncultured Clostridium sp. TaxID=59620 RepID=UPI0027DB2FE4|nr:glycosyltransferase family 2 protein [uncultured Clostridium sp.]